MATQEPVKIVTAHSYAAYRQDWLDLRAEEAIEPELPIVDPHHHLYGPPRPLYLFDQLRADTASGHNIVATVFLDSRAMYRADGPEAMRCVGEIEFANGVAAMSASGGYGPSRLCAAIVGSAPLMLGAAVREVLEAQIAAGNGRFRGIRYISFWDADPEVQPAMAERPPGLLADRRFRAGFAALGPLGLTFDAYLCHPQIPELTDLARAFPGTAIVLDHLGMPAGVGPYGGRRDEVFRSWRADLRELARCPNVHVKLGGLGLKIAGFGFHELPRPPSSDDLAQAFRPYVETAIEAFGPRRSMFESNFPPDRGSFGYAVLWNAFKKIARGASDADRRSLFAGTAARVYRVGLAGLADG